MTAQQTGRQTGGQAHARKGHVMSQTVTETNPRASRQGRRGRPAGSANTRTHDLSKVDLSVIESPLAVDESAARQAAPRQARGEAQEKMDAVAQRMHAMWVQAGRPAAWEKLPKGQYNVPPEAAETYRYMLRRAAAIHGIRARFGQPFRIESGPDAGKEAIVFSFLDKRPRESSAS